MKRLTRKLKLELVMEYAKRIYEKTDISERAQYTFKVNSVSLVGPNMFRICLKAFPINRQWEAFSYTDSTDYFTFEKELDDNGEYTGEYTANTNYVYTNKEKNILWA
jgi:hypothetical protein